MPFELVLKELPLGYAMADATGVEGAPARVLFREFTSSEDGELFISRLDGWPTSIISQLPPEANVRIPEIDHVVAVIRSDRSATVYANELPIVARVRATRSLEAGALVTEDDFGDIRDVDFGIEIPTDAGLLVIMSAKWRKGLFFDFGPINGQGDRDYDVRLLLSSYFAYLYNQAAFSLTEDDWTYLISSGWFPFVGLPKALLRTLVGRARSRSPLDLLVPQVRDAVERRLDTCLESWATKEAFGSHLSLLQHAAERFRAGDYISTTAILFPRIEGLLRDVQQRSAPGAQASQSSLSSSAVRAATHAPHSWLLPAAFERYLKDWYFANFTPGAPAPISRNSVGHGVAAAEAFDQKAAALAFLIVEQISWLLPVPDNPTT